METCASTHAVARSRLIAGREQYTWIYVHHSSQLADISRNSRILYDISSIVVYDRPSHRQHMSNRGASPSFLRSALCALGPSCESCRATRKPRRASARTAVQRALLAANAVARYVSSYGRSRMTTEAEYCTVCKTAACKLFLYVETL